MGIGSKEKDVHRENFVSENHKLIILQKMSHTLLKDSFLKIVAQVFYYRAPDQIAA